MKINYAIKIKRDPYLGLKFFHRSTGRNHIYTISSLKDNSYIITWNNIDKEIDSTAYGKFEVEKNFNSGNWIPMIIDKLDHENKI